eukprot:m.709897 g.709897  ORF g.709897 m.709897 type:complete len:87 (-) comp22948_c0_seq5:2305-2565(-)
MKNVIQETPFSNVTRLQRSGHWRKVYHTNATHGIEAETIHIVPCVLYFRSIVGTVEFGSEKHQCDKWLSPWKLLWGSIQSSAPQWQ